MIFTPVCFHVGLCFISDTVASRAVVIIIDVSRQVLPGPHRLIFSGRGATIVVGLVTYHCDSTSEVLADLLVQSASILEYS